MDRLNSIVIRCTMTALVILTSGAWTLTGADGGGLTGAVPNLIGLILLAPMVFKVTRRYFEDEGMPLASPLKKA